MRCPRGDSLARAWHFGLLIYDPTGSSLSRAGAQARAEDPNLAEWARKFQGDDEDEVPLLPAHLEAHWVVLSCEPWNMIFNLAPYLGRVVVDMWDFKKKLAVRPAARAFVGTARGGSVGEGHRFRGCAGRKCSVTSSPSRTACRTRGRSACLRTQGGERVSSSTRRRPFTARLVRSPLCPLPPLSVIGRRCSGAHRGGMHRARA